MQEDKSLDYVIFDGVRFLESLTRHYGTDKGMEIWEKMGEVLGSEVKGKIFFNLITRGSSDRVRIRRGDCTQAVSVIKAIRTATGFGLKEAKDAWDMSNTSLVTLEVEPGKKHTLISSLRDLGMIVT